MQKIVYLKSKHKHKFKSLSATSLRAIEEKSDTADNASSSGTLVRHIDRAEQFLTVQRVIDGRHHGTISMRLRLTSANPGHVANRQLDDLTGLTGVSDVRRSLAVEVATLQPETLDHDYGGARHLALLE